MTSSESLDPLTHRNQHAVEVSALLLVSVCICSTQKVPEPLEPSNPQDVDARVAAEGLKQREVDLQGHIVLVVRSQDAQNHTLGISERQGKSKLGKQKTSLVPTCLELLDLVMCFPWNGS